MQCKDRRGAGSLLLPRSNSGVNWWSHLIDALLQKCTHKMTLEGCIWERKSYLWERNWAIGTMMREVNLHNFRIPGIKEIKMTLRNSGMMLLKLGRGRGMIRNLEFMLSHSTSIRIKYIFRYAKMQIICHLHICKKNALQKLL